MLIIVIYVQVLFVEYMLQKCSRVRVFLFVGISINFTIFYYRHIEDNIYFICSSNNIIGK